MPTMDLAGVAVDIDSERFLTDHTQWNREIARELAREEGITDLTDRHFEIICFFRKEYVDNSVAPSLRKLRTELGVSGQEFYSLFPGGPNKMVARIAGIQKPQSC